MKNTDRLIEHEFKIKMQDFTFSDTVFHGNGTWGKKRNRNSQHQKMFEKRVQKRRNKKGYRYNKNKK